MRNSSSEVGLSLNRVGLSTIIRDRVYLASTRSRLPNNLFGTDLGIGNNGRNGATGSIAPRIDNSCYYWSSPPRVWGERCPTETVAPTLPSTANGVKPPPPHSKRQQRSALRLQEFQKKRAAAVQDFVTQGADPVVAQEKVPTFALGILTQS